MGEPKSIGIQDALELIDMILYSGVAPRKLVETETELTGVSLNGEPVVTTDKVYK